MAMMMTSDDYNIYFSGQRENVHVIDISKISITSGRITVMDHAEVDFVGGEYTPSYTEEIPIGEYDVKASIVDYGTGCFRIAAVKTAFTEEIPKIFKMAVYENQDISKLGDDQFYGFSIDSGFAIVGDTKVINEYCEVLEQFAEDEDIMSPAIEYYESNLEKMLEDGYKKYPEYRVDFIDYVVPETEQHIAFMSTGYGDGVYPVYFGYDKNGGLCCAVVEFIFTDDDVFN